MIGSRGRILRTYDSDGCLVETQAARSKAKRYSMQGRADQRQLDSMFKAGVVTGTITIANTDCVTNFKFVDGVSQWVN